MTEIKLRYLRVGVRVIGELEVLGDWRIEGVGEMGEIEERGG